MMMNVEAVRRIQNKPTMTIMITGEIIAMETI